MMNDLVKIKVNIGDQFSSKFYIKCPQRLQIAHIPVGLFLVSFAHSLSKC